MVAISRVEPAEPYQHIPSSERALRRLTFARQHRRLEVKRVKRAETLATNDRCRNLRASALQPAFDRKLEHLQAKQAESR
jgi:hypothetical protein